LISGSQYDELHRQAGDDILQRANSADMISFYLDDTGSDTITDFNPTDGHRLDLSRFRHTNKQDVLDIMSDLEGERLLERV
jgi:hypothetical protein